MEPRPYAGRLGAGKPIKFVTELSARRLEDIWTPRPNGPVGDGLPDNLQRPAFAIGILEQLHVVKILDAIPEPPEPHRRSDATDCHMCFQTLGDDSSTMSDPEST